MRIHYLIHAQIEDPGLMTLWTAQYGHQVTQTFLPDTAFPSLQDFDWLVIMGGGMSVYEEDRLPWLIEENVSFARPSTPAKRCWASAWGHN